MAETDPDREPADFRDRLVALESVARRRDGEIVYLRSRLAASHIDSTRLKYSVVAGFPLVGIVTNSAVAWIRYPDGGSGSAFELLGGTRGSSWALAYLLLAMAVGAMLVSLAGAFGLSSPGGWYLVTTVAVAMPLAAVMAVGDLPSSSTPLAGFGMALLLPLVLALISLKAPRALKDAQLLAATI